jgi:serine/threonine protein kinase
MHAWEAFMTQALEALCRLHSLGFVHGSIDASTLRIDTTLRLHVPQIHGAETEFPAEDFRPHNVLYAPERIIHQGKAEGLSLFTVMTAMESENYPADRISTAFGGSIPYTAIWDSPPDPKAGDVWMLGYTLYQVYSDMISAASCHTKHDSFMDVIGSMVALNPAKRWTAKMALDAWFPCAPLTEPDDETCDLPVEPPVHPTISVRKHPRLILKRGDGPVAHNKTRRNRGN